MRISKPGDRYEQQADRVADAIVSATARISPPLVYDQGRAGILGAMASEPHIQRETVTDEPEGAPEPLRGDEEDEERLVMPRALASEQARSSATLNAVQAALDLLPTRGAPMQPALRHYFEPRFGHDFSRVRVHTDSASAQLAQQLNARAFTYRNNIVFGHNAYSPGTRAGLHLLAHELTHTVQQGHTGTLAPGDRTQAGLIQRAQVGHVHTPSTGTPYFLYELDASVPDFATLARYYGVAAGDITAMNPGVRASAGTRVQAPAYHPPAAAAASFGGSGQAQIVTGSRVNVRWTAHRDSNKVGQLNSGNIVPEVFSAGHGLYSSAFVDPLNLANRADGIIDELKYLNLTSGPASPGNYILAFVPTAHIAQRTLHAQNALAKAATEHAAGVVERPACTNRGADVDKYTGVTGPSPVIRGNRVRSGRCGRAWCAYFVKWCLDQAGVSNQVTGAAVSVKRWGRNKGWYHRVTAVPPMRGDIFYKQPSGGGTHPCDTNPCVSRGRGTGHVGFVTGTSGSNVQTVEGNVNVSSTNDGINALSRPLSDLEGVVRIP